MHDFGVNAGFSKRKCVILGVKRGIVEETMHDLGLEGGFLKRKRVIFGLNSNF